MSLSIQDLRRLRASVRRVQMRHYPDRHVSDHEADKIIASLGPEVAEKQIKAQVDAGILPANKQIDFGRLKNTSALKLH